MKRRDFLRATLVGGAVAAVSPLNMLAGCDSTKKKKTELKLSFQEGTAPGETLEQKFDFMEQNGVVGFEPGGAGLAARVGELQKLLQGRNIKVSAICAGFQGFILSEDEAVRQQFDQTMREIIAAAGELDSTGVIMVPAFNGQVPAMPHTMDTRNYLVDQLRQLGDYAVQCGTTVILEPLNRNEAFYLRQVASTTEKPAACGSTASAPIVGCSSCRNEGMALPWSATGVSPGTKVEAASAASSSSASTSASATPSFIALTASIMESMTASSSSSEEISIGPAVCGAASCTGRSS